MHRLKSIDVLDFWSWILLIVQVLKSRNIKIDTLNVFCLINSREDFMRIPELAINPIGERIIDAFFMNEESK